MAHLQPGLMPQLHIQPDLNAIRTCRYIRWTGRYQPIDGVYGPAALQPAVSAAGGHMQRLRLVSCVAAGSPENSEIRPNNQHSSVHPLPNIAGTCHKGFAFVLILVGTLFVQATLTNGKENT
jgi:hypothetical protein